MKCPVCGYPYKAAGGDCPSCGYKPSSGPLFDPGTDGIAFAIWMPTLLITCLGYLILKGPGIVIGLVAGIVITYAFWKFWIRLFSYLIYIIIIALILGVAGLIIYALWNVK